jgi:lipopolysaccharide transport system permease protein
MTTLANEALPPARTSGSGRPLGEGDDYVITIRPPRGVTLGLRELFQHRELLYFLAWRDIKVRYKQTVLGAAWALLQPVATMVVFSLVFGRLAQLPSDGVPYPLFAMAGLVPWAFFSTAMSAASGSLVANAGLLTKVYFTRLTIPIAAVLGTALDFLLGLLLLLAMGLYFHYLPTVRLFAVPLLFGIAFAGALGVGLWLSALNLQFRDVRYAVPFLLQMWMFATPVVYPSSLVPEPWRTVYGLNPMAGVVEGFRWAVLGVNNAPGNLMLMSASSALVFLVTGAFYFRYMEKSFSDMV